MITPSRIVRYGITVIALILVSLLFLSWWIKYPEVIQSRITVTATESAIKVNTKTFGELVLSVKDNDLVSFNQQLGYIRTPANIEDVKILKSKLDQFTGETFPEAAYQLGEIQLAYVQFIQAVHENYWYRHHANIERSQALISQKIAQNKSLQKALSERQDIVAKQNKLLEARFKSEEDLVNQHYLSAKDVQDTQQQHNQKQFEVANEKVQLLQHQMEETQLYADRLERSRQYQQELSSRQREVQRTYATLMSQINEWEKNYIIKAPASGKVSLFQIWSQIQTVQPSQEVLSIVPPNNYCLGKIYVPGVRIGKVKIGQKVVVKLDAYPFAEYGTLVGEVTHISKLARENIFVLDVRFPKGWISSSKKNLHVVQGMQGKAEIITRDLRLIQRIFYHGYRMLCE
jgi:hypothetical protein